MSWSWRYLWGERVYFILLPGRFFERCRGVAAGTTTSYSNKNQTRAGYQPSILLLEDCKIGTTEPFLCFIGCCWWRITRNVALSRQSRHSNGSSIHLPIFVICAPRGIILGLWSHEAHDGASFPPFIVVNGVCRFQHQIL